MKQRALTAAVVAVIVGTALQVVYMRRFEQKVSGGVPVGVVVAARDLSAGQELTADLLGSRQIPSAYVDLRHIRGQDTEALLGESLSTAVRSGESLLWSDLQMDPTRAADLATRVRPGMRAVTLHAAGDPAFADLLRPGDRVDVLLSSAAVDAPSANAGWTETLLQNVLVLAVGSDVGVRAAERSNVHRGIRQVTVSVSPAGAQVVAQAQLRGRLTLTLRNPDDAALVSDVERVLARDVVARPLSRASTIERHSLPAMPAPMEVDRAR